MKLPGYEPANGAWVAVTFAQNQIESNLGRGIGVRCLHADEKIRILIARNPYMRAIESE